MIRKLMNNIGVLFLLMAAFYFTGFALMPEQDTAIFNKAMHSVNANGYVDDYGDDTDFEIPNPISIDGIGRVLTYEEVYALPLINLYVGTMIFWLLTYGEEHRQSYFSAACIVTTNAMSGIILIYLTDKPHILPTVFYWLGIIVAAYSVPIGAKPAK